MKNGSSGVITTGMQACHIPFPRHYHSALPLTAWPGTRVSGGRGGGRGGGCAGHWRETKCTCRICRSVQVFAVLCTASGHTRKKCWKAENPDQLIESLLLLARSLSLSVRACGQALNLLISRVPFFLSPLLSLSSPPPSFCDIYSLNVGWRVVAGGGGCHVCERVIEIQF